MSPKAFNAHYSGIKRSPQGSHRLSISGRLERSGLRPGLGSLADEGPEEGAAGEPLSRDDLDLLIYGEGELCASFYLPVGGGGPAAMQGGVRLKNLLRTARRELALQGATPAETQALLAPVAALVDDPSFWPSQADGLALFSAPGFFRSIELPAAPAEQVAIGRRFTIRPLVGALVPEAPFYVLALSVNHVRLVEVGPAEQRRIEVPRLPASLEDALGYTVLAAGPQVHAGGPHMPGGGHQGKSLAYGHGDEERSKADLMSYFRQIHKALAPVLSDEAPLVLAAVEEYAPLYARAAGDLAPLAGVLPGSPDRLSDGELGEMARLVMRPRWLAERERELDHWRELVGTSRASAELAEIVPAAADGRVEVLFLADAGERWGHFDPAARSVEMHPERRDDDEDLLETALRSTLAAGGTVFTLPLGLMPHGELAAAALRY